MLAPYPDGVDLVTITIRCMFDVCPVMVALWLVARSSPRHPSEARAIRFAGVGAREEHCDRAECAGWVVDMFVV